jgi:hypothetical protein
MLFRTLMSACIIVRLAIRFEAAAQDFVQFDVL